MNNNKSSRRINILRDSVARRIAAGEVIDRPQAVVRELLDNSIDAESTEITLHIEKGGMSEIRIIDNGTGMDASDLERCFLPHATSKIVDFEDIYSTKTLGFRGEALSSIASCSKLEIVSSVSDSLPANRLEVYDGKLRHIGEFRGAQGTLISVKDLFFSMPGRKNFLKSPGAEAAQCRSMFIEKALPQPDISFRYFNEGRLKLFLPASDQLTRVKNAFGGLFQPSFLGSFENEDGDIKISAVAGSPSLYRKDRKYIHVFINNRRVSDYSLVQAVDYAYSSFLPGGCHPVCFLFLTIPPEHLDFNIHPAKREVKFRNLPGIHHAVSSSVAAHLAGVNSFRASAAAKSGPSQPVLGFPGSVKRDSPPRAVADRIFSPAPSTAGQSIFRKQSLGEIKSSLTAADKAPETGSPSPAATVAAPVPGGPPPESTARLIYLGQLFNLFLLFERDDDLLLIDQHAAHERLIYNSLSNGRPEIQELLVPLRFELESDADQGLRRNIEIYRELGFQIEPDGDGCYHIDALPAVCDGLEDQITGFFKDNISDAEELKRKLYAMISCRSAIKDGDRIDEIRAIELASEILMLETPRCPHGRPVLQLISRDELYKMFGRTF